jgi:hypothetical protein
MATRPRGKTLRALVNFAALTIGIGAGVAQLAGFSDGLGQLVLTVVGISCLLFLVVRFTLLYYVRRAGQLQAEIDKANQRTETLEVGHHRYVDAVNRIIDQEGLIYTERLTLTITIGTDDTGDRVEECRHTTPNPRVTNRAIRPIVPDDVDRLVSLEEIGFKATLAEIAGSITALPLTRNHRPRVWLVFDPGLTAPFDWVITYSPAGLWAPLRRNGFDHLVWTDRLPADSGNSSVLSDLVVKIVFPDVDGKPPHVAELHSFGDFQPPERLDGGAGWLITWRDAQPSGRRYEWRLAQTPRVGGPDATITPAAVPSQRRRFWPRIVRSS